MSNYQLLEGYKQTEVGIIPKDWEVRKLADILKIRHGKSQREVVDPDGIYPILGTGGEIGKTNVPLYAEPSVLIGRKGTIDSPRYIDTPFWTVDTLFYSEIFKNTDAKFVFYKFNLIDWYSYNEASGVPSLNAATIEKIEQAFPILKEEQSAIAQALSDVDALIAALDKLIAKKRDLKTATMQQLLTGKKRLPGFGEGRGYKKSEIGLIPEDWKVRGLESLGLSTIPSIKAGPFGSSLTKNTYVPTGYKIYGQEQVINGDYLYGDYFISPKKFKELESCAVKPGDILLSLVGTAGKLLVIPDDAPPGIINPRLIRLSFDKDLVNSHFFKALFESGEIQSFLSRYAQGGTMSVLNASTLRSVNIPLPSISEQRMIALVLSDLDNEIAALESRLAKIQAIKQGMMQQLLIGRTRLV